jgi:hypothetical protein
MQQAALLLSGFKEWGPQSFGWVFSFAEPRPSYDPLTPWMARRLADTASTEAKTVCKGFPSRIRPLRPSDDLCITETCEDWST